MRGNRGGEVFVGMRESVGGKRMETFVDKEGEIGEGEVWERLGETAEGNW